MPDQEKPREFIVIPIPEGWYGERILADMKDDWKDEYADTLLVPAIREAFIDSACLVRREEARERMAKAMWKAEPGSELCKWKNLTPQDRGVFLRVAAAALDALTGEGE